MTMAPCPSPYHIKMITNNRNKSKKNHLRKLVDAASASYEGHKKASKIAERAEEAAMISRVKQELIELGGKDGDRV